LRVPAICFDLALGCHGCVLGWKVAWAEGEFGVGFR
jgi:hypothetical protein